ncbi:Protein methyltransferase [Candidatus Hepatincola sp. Av]
MKDLKRTFPSWHYAMLSDKKRNEQIKYSIKSINLIGKSVFEIGSGAGLVALLFAKYGAKKVLTCEENQQLFEITKLLIKENGYEHIITVINKNSKDVIEQGLLDFQPDIIFTETLDCGVIGEGYYSISQDISKIKTENTIILPHIINQFGFLVSSESMQSLNYIAHNTLSFDLSLINQYSTKNYFPIRLKNYDYKKLSHDISIKNYKYIPEQSDIKSIKFRALQDSFCHGLVSYFEAYFGNYTVTNHISEGNHWHQAFHPLKVPVFLTKDQKYELKINKNLEIKII